MDDSILSDGLQVAAFREQVQAELERLIDFWAGEHVLDLDNGGFIGQMTGRGVIIREAEKAVVLNSRLLWAFAAVANQTGNEICRQRAQRAFDFFREHFKDPRYGGVFWMLDATGQVLHDKKQVYAQAFAIYGLTEYYRLTADQDALDWALEIFDLLESHSLDSERGGYLEAFDREWRRLEDMRLSNIDANEAKTMNTHLHLIEAYTNLHRVYPHLRSEKALANIVRTYQQHFIRPGTGHLNLFFDEEWNLKSEEISFGHDIESAWLLLEAAEVLQDQSLVREMRSLAVRIAEVTLAEGMSAGGGLMNERAADGTLRAERVWWIQAEAMVGFINAFQVSGEVRYYRTTAGIWSFVRDQMIDTGFGEWWWSITPEGAIDKDLDKVGPWKGPYHNVRACLEILSRLSGL